MTKLMDYQILTNLSELGYTRFYEDNSFKRVGAFSDRKEVLRFYDESFDVLNARFVNLNGSRVFAKQNIYKACLVIQHLNPDVKIDELRRWIRSKIRRFQGSTLLKPIEAKGISEYIFGKEYDIENLITKSSVVWKSSYPLDNPYDKETESKQFFEHLVTERQRFALKCYNTLCSTKSITDFFLGYEAVKEVYGTVSLHDIATSTNKTISSIRKTYNKIKDSIEDIEKIDTDFKDKRYVDSQRRIIKGGESIHYDDRLKITKSRVSVKASVSRPTVDNHWIEVGDYFNLLNEQLTDKQ